MNDRTIALHSGFPDDLAGNALTRILAKHGRAARLSFLIIIAAALLASHPSSAQIPAVPTTAPGGLIDAGDYIRAERLGITFVGFIDNNMGPERYRNALILGSGWNRWPLYWDRVELQPGEYNWLAYDKLVATDIRHGLRTNAILLGRPVFWQAGDSISNLFQPIFADGTDSGGPDVAINLDNPWAQYVHYAVMRYMPGGVLAQHNNFGAEAGIRAWEVWNEPDVPHFWSAGSEAYARLLKVAAIVIRTVDPEAKVLFGGLLYANDQGFLSRVLRQIRSDPLRDRFDWFFDVIALHSYDDPWRSGWLAKVVEDTLKSYQIRRPVWLNETGVSVWDDYPGPVWAHNPEQRSRLATARQQAYFLVMSAAFAWAKGVEVVFYHQLYDDCGNYPAGSDFEPHGGELCANGLCFGDAFGIYRNARGSHCFSHHPHANTPRPVARAFLVLAEVFGSQAFAPISLAGIDDDVTEIVFQRSSGERIIVLWNNTSEALTVTLKATGADANLHFVNGETTLFPAINGNYTLDLKPASDYSFPDLERNRSSAIGGEPIILVESPSP